MRYRLLECSSEACSETSTTKCPCRGKVITCLDTTCVCVYEYNEHLSAADDPKKKKFTKAQKDFCRELADQHLRPMRIRLALSRKFETSLMDLPPLTTVQNFVNYYSRTYLENYDRLKELKMWIYTHAYNGSEQMTQPFAFGCEYDSDGKLVVGNGSDESPFIVGLTTKALMLRMMLPPEYFVLHVEGTYKTNYVDYTVVVLGVSDRSRGFHLVALFIVSQETQSVFEAVLLALRRLYFWIAGKELVVQYAMDDGDKAQCSALHSKALKRFPSHLLAAVQSDIHDLHSTRTQASFLQMQDAVLRKWMEDSRLLAFSQYMSAQWLYGPFNIESAGHSAIVRIQALAPPRIAVVPNNCSEAGIAVSAQMGANYTRMEILNQPWGGWQVVLWRQSCPCNYWFMFGSCVHVLYALRMTAYVDSQGRDILVSRKKRRRHDAGAVGSGDRPRRIGPALSYE
ncbi:hypothetical protein F441_02778 [Phytophthora nicotianae CJ01A1]|uniref:MULE transposase domain-containing protein n=1 Tax=Phytophthora nicotianae CJ01A1 TaxID=1317063 RepID=W2XNE8_PHYNI|nr:hypothetical protein F441_02778 [Phytophthora nicotianae CJ01A1]